ncbi:hypothetical protein RAK11_06975 [Bordetella bronchiseptica]|uniref:hypothetical protein n=1 Tax=Bordetella bronchiseptica TaxID=518 RepID=UPI0013E8F4C4|nr:hypothetical protein [Bordetella bronchiseptica]WLS60414.1 hypothetical protein RAK14_06975 [Bordetella bronchiseptica]WLS61560.1 hypothetical protein RAK14_24640 [Bordetella bronchiseptica]WLS65248.1 hypothetical protein RAK11_06975 [Bordetella bronchiseptica]
MTTVTKFFEDNIKRLSAHANPLEWNLNHGLLALAKQMTAIQREQSDIEQRLQRIEQLLRSR